MKTGGSYTRNGNFGDLVWKKFGENRFIFNSAGWKIGLHDHIGQNGGGFFKGKDLQTFYLLVIHSQGKMIHSCKLKSFLINQVSKTYQAMKKRLGLV